MEKRRAYQKTLIISLMLILVMFIVSCSNETQVKTINNNEHIQQTESVEPNTTGNNTEDNIIDPPLDSSEVNESITVGSPAPVKGGKQLKVHFIDVGQGDAIFIDYGDYDILIDGGNNEDGSLVANYLRSLGTDDIEILVGTHNHADHIGGLDTVLQEFQVETIIDSGKSHTTITYTDYYNAAKNEPNAKFIEDSDMSFDMGGGAVFRVIEAGDGYSDFNETSVVTMLDYGDVEFLFTGDLDSSVELGILNKGINADVLKVGHHGSNTSSSDAFLSRVNPEVAVISAGLNNSYGHPHAEALNRITKHTKNIYGTWVSGTIVVSTDGNTYSVDTNNKVIDPQQGSTQTTAPITTKTKSTPIQKEAAPNVQFLGSVNSDKYHFTDCGSASRIKDANKVWFTSPADALDKGYVPCKVCSPPQ